MPEFANVSTVMFAADIRTLGPGKVVHAAELEKNPAKIPPGHIQVAHVCICMSMNMRMLLYLSLCLFWCLFGGVVRVER